MGESQPPRRIYSAHREKQRRHILATAQTLFDQHGIERVTVADIIAAHHLQSRDQSHPYRLESLEDLEE